VENNPSDRVFMAWDAVESNFINFRKDGTDYKGHRNREEHQEIHSNDLLLKKITNLLGVVNITANKMEADDIIAWICLELYPSDENLIVSSDQDFYQLIAFGENVSVYSPMKMELVN